MTQESRLFAVKPTQGRCGYVDRMGRLQIPPKFDSAGNFSEGLAPVSLQGRNVLIDMQGNVVAEPVYQGRRPSQIFPFEQGSALARFDAGDSPKIGALDRTGALVIPPEYDQIGDFVDGIAPARISFKGRPKHGSHAVLKGIDWGLQPPEFLKAIPGAQAHRLVLVGIASGGNVLLCIDANDPNPEDPAVYVVDHDDRFDAKSCQAGSLSGFLSCLILE